MTRLSKPPGPQGAATAEAEAVPSLVSRWTDIYLELGKARLSALVVATAGVGFLVAAPRPIAWGALLVTLVGTTLAAWSANALNQVIEAKLDALMPRTKGRPLPTKRMTSLHATVAAVVAGVAGISLLVVFTNMLAAGLALATILLYVFCYTPLKTRSHLNTLVGAVVGAVPPMIGWAAATNSIDLGAWVLAAILFVWQIPHFLALAWLCREDYRLGGFKMLTLHDPSGAITSRAILLWSLALIPVTLAATITGVSGLIYAVGALLLGLWVSVLAIRLIRQTERANARKVFLASVLYLPLLMTLMVCDRGTVGNAATYNSVEVMHFDDHGEAFDQINADPHANLPGIDPALQP